MEYTLYFVNSVNNSAGVLYLKEDQFGNYFWQMGDKEGDGKLHYRESMWAGIPKSLFNELVKHPETIKSKKKVSLLDV